MDDAKDSVTSIHVTDHEVMTGSADGRVRRYDLRAGKLMCDLIGSKYVCQYLDTIVMSTLLTKRCCVLY